MKYTEKEREKLAGWAAFTPGTIEDWTPEELKQALPKKKWPLITVNRLDSELQDKVSTVYNALCTDGIDVSAHTTAMLMVCLKDLKNYCGIDGNPVEFEIKDGLVTIDVIKRISQQMKTAIYMLITTGDYS